MTADDLAALELTAKRVRLSLVEMHHRAQTGHLGGALSCVDVLVALMHGHGRVILSKGHAASALYASVAAVQPRIAGELERFNTLGSTVPEQPKPGGFATEWATGSLGHGLSVGLGMAWAKPDQHVYVVMSDGECQEGSVWEAAMLAATLNVPNLTAIIDANGWQAIGRTVTPNDWLWQKFRAFGWRVTEIDGHAMRECVDALTDIAAKPPEGPTCIIAKTVKGGGIPFIAANDRNDWHYRHPSAEDVERARQELGLA